MHGAFSSSSARFVRLQGVMWLMLVRRATVVYSIDARLCACYVHIFPIYEVYRPFPPQRSIARSFLSLVLARRCKL